MNLCLGGLETLSLEITERILETEMIFKFPRNKI